MKADRETVRGVATSFIVVSDKCHQVSSRTFKTVGSLLVDSMVEVSEERY